MPRESVMINYKKVPGIRQSFFYYFLYWNVKRFEKALNQWFDAFLDVDQIWSLHIFILSSIQQL